MVALEGLAVGAPIVAFDVAGVVEACGDAARYAPVGNVSALADAIAETANSTAETAAQIERGQARSADFSWKHAWREFGRLVEHCS